MGNECNLCKERITMTFVGDLFLASRAQKNLLQKDSSSFLDWTAKYNRFLDSGDVLFANFEGVITNENVPARDKALPANFTLGFSKNAAEFLRGFKKIALSLSNNHIADFGYEGIEQTLAFLKENHISYAGAGTTKEAYGYRVLVQKGVRIGFLAFTDLLPREYYAEETRVGAASAAPEAMRRAIARARGEVDLIVVSLHTVANILGGPRYFPDKHQKELAKICAEAGANIVFGHQQHCAQDFSIYNGCLVFHGLGALLYDPQISEAIYEPRLKMSTKISGGAIAIVECCKHGVRSFQVRPTKTVKNAEGGFMLKATGLKERTLVLFSFAKAAGQGLFKRV